MSAVADLRTLLLANATVAATVGTRVYPVELPQNPTLPAIRYSIISGQRTHSQPGVSGLYRPRVQVDCYATTYAAAHALAEAANTALDAYRGAAGSSTVQGAFATNEQDFYEPDMKAFLISRDFYVWFGQS